LHFLNISQGWDWGWNEGENVVRDLV
jgi:hypothetical protein